MVNIQIDGQVFPMIDEVADSDELLKAALVPFVPWIANARIERKIENGTTTISVIKRADTKGSFQGAVFAALQASPEQRNPAVALWQAMEGQMDLNDPGVILALEPRITQALVAGDTEVKAVQQALAHLITSAPVDANRTPLGF